MCNNYKNNRVIAFVLNTLEIEQEIVIKLLEYEYDELIIRI